MHPQITDIRQNRFWTPDAAGTPKENTELIIIAVDKQYTVHVDHQRVATTTSGLVTTTSRFVCDSATQQRLGLELLLSLPDGNPFKGLTEEMLKVVEKHNSKVEKQAAKGGNLFDQDKKD